jgi:hypothetical protein
MKDEGGADHAREGAIAAVLVVLATTAYLFYPLALGRFFEWDVPEQYWPDLVYLCRSLHRGALPLWNPFDRGGYPYYADPQAGTYHPLNWGICAVAGPAPSLAWAELRVVVGFLSAGLFGLLWLRRLKVSWAAATLGAVVIECAPFMRHNWELNLTFAMGFLPMVLWAFERLLSSRRARDAALLALAIGLLVWAGSPPVVFFGGTFAALYALGRVIEERRRDPSVLKPILSMLALSLLLAGGLTAVVLVPGLTLAGYSVQAGRSYASISEGGLTLSEASAFLWPRDGNHLYVGWLALLLTPFAVANKARIPGLWVFVLAAPIAVLLTLGDHGPLFGLAFDWVPGVHLFRLPHRYEAWLGPIFGALAAGGLDAALARGAVRFPVLARAHVVVGLGVVLPLVMVLDLTQRMPADRHTRALPAPGDAATAARVLSHARDPSYRVMDEFGISCRSGTRLSRRDLRGYQDPLLLHAYERVLSSLRAHPELAMQLNVRWALTGPHFIHGWDRHFLPPPPELLALSGAIDRGDGVIELTRAMPLAYVVPSAEVEHVRRREDALLRVIERAPAPLAIVEDGDGSELAPRGAPVLRAARVVSYGTDALTLEASTDTDATLVVNETWYPGWRAYVDGEETPVVRANGLVRALALPPGEHEVELRFLPADGMSLRWLLVAAWLAVVGLLVAPRIRALRTARGGASSSEAH